MPHLCKSGLFFKGHFRLSSTKGRAAPVGSSNRPAIFSHQPDYRFQGRRPQLSAEGSHRISKLEVVIGHKEGGVRW